jgi:hypothetical protein
MIPTIWKRLQSCFPLRFVIMINIKHLNNGNIMWFVEDPHHQLLGFAAKTNHSFTPLPGMQ